MFATTVSTPRLTEMTGFPVRPRPSFVCEQDDEWMLTFDLSRFLKVSRVEDELGRSLRFFQNSEMTKDEEISRLGHDVVIVMMPEPMRRGEREDTQVHLLGRSDFAQWEAACFTSARAEVGIRTWERPTVPATR